MPSSVPFEGTPPAVERGDRIERRDAYGNWHETVAQSAPRYDYKNCIGGRCYLTVAVPWNGKTVNWPAEDVRPLARLEAADEPPSRQPENHSAQQAAGRA